MLSWQAKNSGPTADLHGTERVNFIKALISTKIFLTKMKGRIITEFRGQYSNFVVRLSDHLNTYNNENIAINY